MFGRMPLSRSGNFLFTVFVLAVMIFTIIAFTYQPEDPLIHPSTKILMSTSSATFKYNDTVSKTGKEFMTLKQTTFKDFINVSDVSVPAVPSASECDRDLKQAIPCKDPDIFHLMMTAAIEHFKDIHFYRFGKPVPGSNSSTCDMAWRFRPKEGKTVAFYKDYRRFVFSRDGNCNYTVIGIGDYHTGVNARKRKKNQKDSQKTELEKTLSGGIIPVVGEVVNDALPVVESENSFGRGKYLIYTGGGDRCKSMNQYLWSFLCALGEAQYLNRTLVMDLTLCLSSMYTSSNQDEEGKDFRFYFDFEHLKELASVLEQSQFWSDWAKWEKNGLGLYLVEDTKVTPMKLSEVNDTLIMRKFGSVEPDNYWYGVCEGETESVIQRPWHMIWKSRCLMDIVSLIDSRMNWDFDAVHVERGRKASNTELWPHLAADTSPEGLVSSLHDKIEDGRNLYIATNERNTSFFDPLKAKYKMHFLDDYQDLWDKNSEWLTETMKLNGGNQVEFDGYMRVLVDTEVFLRGKKQIETFNDLTNDCRDGSNTCLSTA